MKILGVILSVAIVFAVAILMFMFAGWLLMVILTWLGVQNVSYWFCVGVVVLVWFLGQIFNAGK